MAYDLLQYDNQPIFLAYLPYQTSTYRTNTLTFDMENMLRISVGCPVEGGHGSLISNANPAIKRRIRSRAVGTVLRSVDQRKWKVVFDFDAKVKTVSSSSLTIVERGRAIPLIELNTVRILSMIFIDVVDY